MTLDSKALSVARKAVRGEGLGVRACEERLIKAYLDAADLVERKTLDANTLGHMVDEKLFHLEAERDEARNKAEMLAERSNGWEVLAGLRGKQLAALRAVVGKSPCPRSLEGRNTRECITAGQCSGCDNYAVLTNTAEAAASEAGEPEPEGTP